MSSSLQHREISIRDLVKSIVNGDYSIPKFQREFVWRKGDILSLGDSIIRGYPIGSLLTMPAGGSLKVSADPLKISGSIVNKDVMKTNYILDGQQRVTSIAKLFTELDNDEIYYFDLLEILSENFPEDRIELKVKPVTKEDGFCRSFNKKNGEYTNTKENNRFISGALVLKDGYAAVISKFLKTLAIENDENDVKSDKYNNYLNALLGSVTSFGMPITSIDGDADLGVVCRVFEKINSTGIKLTTFDLINAKSFDNIDIPNGISSYLTQDLLKMLASNPNIEELLKDFLGFNSKSNDDYDQRRFNDLGRITRIITIADLLKSGKTPSITNHYMLAKDSGFWLTEWKRYKEQLNRFFNWINASEVFKLMPKSYIEYIAGCVVNHPEILSYFDFMDKVKKKGLWISMQGSQFTKSNIEEVVTLNDRIQKFLNASTLDKHNFLPDYKGSEINPDDIRKLKKSTRNVKYRIALYLMRNGKSRGKFARDLANHEIGANSDFVEFDEHHLIPQSRTTNKSNSDDYDLIGNITLLNTKTNRNDIKNTHIKEYLPILKNKIPEEDFIFICEQNLIPPDFGDDDDFISKRTELVVKFISGYFS